MVAGVGFPCHGISRDLLDQTQSPGASEGVPQVLPLSWSCCSNTKLQPLLSLPEVLQQAGAGIAAAPSTQHAGPIPLLLSIPYDQVEQSGVLDIFSLPGCVALPWINDLLPTLCWGSGTGPHPAPRQEMALIKASLAEMENH